MTSPGRRPRKADAVNQQNRQMRRMAQKQGADQPKRPERRQPAPTQGGSDRPSPTQFFSEVRGELRKVAWPTKNEVINSTIIVLIAVVVMTTLIFGADYLFAKGVLFLYD
jgi:preprotein translocase subunit SecE